MLSCDHHHNYVIFVDHDTRHIWLYLLKKKFDVTFVFESFKRLIEIFFSNLSLLFILVEVVNILDFIPFLPNMVFNISSLQPSLPYIHHIVMTLLKDIIYHGNNINPSTSRFCPTQNLKNLSLM